MSLKQGGQTGLQSKSQILAIFQFDFVLLNIHSSYIADFQ